MNVQFPLNEQELKALFVRLKKEESSLSIVEANILKKAEKTLFSILSVQDMEKLTDV
ncbi:MAG: hypothetical protein LBE74_01890 [Treponema sp.]|jgi:hypothetical protein|nr:hypothetical protein [Treponema sp.]